MLTPEVMGRTLAEAPDPELARIAISRVGEDPEAREVLAREDVLPVAARLLGFSSAAADFLVAHPEETRLLEDVGARGRDQLDQELTDDVARLGPADGLRRFRRRAMLRVAARDLSRAALEEVVAEISAIAEACLATASHEAAPSGLAVIGLGKLGGAELNYASDVDVLFVSDGHGELGSGSANGAERRSAEIIRLLSEPTAEGISLRVDPALRPGGRGGALARSIAAMGEYYASQAATWERQALIKARPVAGDLALGGAFVEMVAPFVYPEELAPRAIDEVRRVKVRLEEYVRARGKAGTEVKRGWGGIRDVEFAVQLLQIVHGRRDDRLRQPNTLRALSVLADEGYVAEQDAAALADAYRFLRVLEHRLQMVRDLQTHELPADRASLTRLARSLGMDGPDALRSEYERQTALVRGLHERLFYRPLLEAFAGPKAPRPGVDREATLELLAGLGFREPSSAYAVLARLVVPSTRLGKVLAHVLPVMAPALALASNPDTALVRLERVAEAIGADAWLADVLASDPRAARRLAHTVSASSFATDLLASRPERILALTGAEEADSAGALVNIVGRYAAGELEPKAVGGEIAAVADRVVSEALAPNGADLPFAVIGLGKLGAEELNFASDLDIVFVYEGEGPDDLRRAGEAGERVLQGIRDAGWEPDADLRPEGRAGPLARSFAAYLEYLERYAETWEFQSLLRARFVAGDEQLGRRFCSFAQDLAYPDYLSLDRAGEILRMRERIERERVRPADAARFHFKLGYGSLADVQFAVELLLMRHGGHYPQIRTRQTLDAIEKLAAARLIEDSVALALGEAFTFLSGVKNALEVDRRVHAEAVPASAEDQAALARRLGYEEYPRQSFLDDYQRITRRARRAMERVFSQGFEGD